MNPLQMHRELMSAYRRFIDSSQRVANPTIAAWIDERIEHGELLWREPLVTLRRRFRAGTALEDMVAAGRLDPVVLKAFTTRLGDPGAPVVAPFLHQADAIELLTGPTARNTIVATGTGSGKSFTFSIPIVSEAMRAKRAGGKGVKAVIVYPMNALANSQYEELAARLAGTGLTIASYTGDMPGSEEQALRGFHEQTGRDTPWDSEVICRHGPNGVQERGVDVLITNYVMLELILTRWSDRKVFPLDQLGALRYLVLDEVHTYTGRRGADVACLIRRLKEHTGTRETLRCVGTSATVDSSSGEEEGRQAIAAFASNLFGAPFAPDGVVIERHADPITPDIPDPLPAEPVRLDDGLIARLADDDPEAVAEAAHALTGGAGEGEAVVRHAAVAFLERSAVEARPWPELVANYRGAYRPEFDEATVAAELEAALLVGNAVSLVTEHGPTPILIPKVHTFVSQGRPITSTIDGILSDRGATTQEAPDGELPAFPLLFCTACGAEALSAELIDDDNGPRYEPSEPFGADSKGGPGYLFPGEWDPEAAPPDEARLKKDGQPRKGWEGARPVNLALAADGSTEVGGAPYAWVPRPLYLCPRCGVQYTRQQNEYQKLFRPGMLGRATATDVLLGEILQRLPSRPGHFKPSVIAFADNRQDTAFQAAHANDFHRRLHFRRALFSALVGRGAVDDPARAVPLDDVGRAVFEAMRSAGSLPRFARDPDITVGPAARRVEQLYKRYLSFCVLADMIGRTRWRNNQTLHDVAALDLVYSGLDELAESDAAWAGVGPMMRAAVDVRADTVRGILDVFRIAGAVGAHALEHGDEFREDVIDRLAPTALFHDPALPPRRPTVFSDEAPTATDHFDLSLRRLTFHEAAPRDRGLVRWIRTLHPEVGDRDAGKSLVRAIVGVLADRHLLLEGAVKGHPSWRLHQDALRVVARRDGRGRRCPRCRTRFEFRADRACPQCAIPAIVTTAHDWAEDYVRAECLVPLEGRVLLLAEEHSAQVPGGERKVAETQFKDSDDPLNTLVCTPTMELGIDIGGLSAVYMRNVPPSPANYAQRQGRAGRHGQPAYVATFCGTAGKFGSHDQYFYRFPERIVSGRIPPPRFLLRNEDLLAAHLNALTLEYLDFRIDDRPSDFIDLDEQEPRFVGDVVRELAAKMKARRTTLADRAINALGAELAEIGRDRGWVEGRLDGFPDRYREAWRPLIDEFTLIRDEARLIAERQEQGDSSRESDLRRTSILNRMNDIRMGRGDFYPYRYLGTQGFLPNFAFPRRPSSVVFADRKESIARHRLIALREFAPEASIYYRGARYRVDRAQPRARGGQVNWTRLKRCVCGWFQTGAAVATAASCPSCGRDLTATFATEFAMEIPDAVARRTGRISSDEEERRRRGYEIRPSYRLPTGAPSGALVGQDEVGTVTYGHAAHLLVTNLGLRGEPGREPDGFRLCERCRRWISSDAEEQDHVSDDNPRGSCPAGGGTEDIRAAVVLFADGRHDVIALDVSPPAEVAGDVFATSLLHALLDGFEVAYSAEEGEIGGYVFSDAPDGRTRILLYERDEGGVGLLHNLLSVEAWVRVAERALELVHVDPATGEQEADACPKACYDCLLSFTNQFDHERLDRRTVIGTLQAIADATTLELRGPEEAWEQLDAAAASSAERAVLAELQRRDCPPPTGQHVAIEDPQGVRIAEADLTWPGRIVVFVDGSPHNLKHVARRDARVRPALKGLGYRVVVIDMDHPDRGYADLLERLGVALPAPVDVQPPLSSAGGGAGEQPPLPPVQLSPEGGSASDGWVPFHDLEGGSLDGPPAVGWVRSAEDLLIEADWFAVQVPGSSQEPRIPRGSVVVIEPLGGQDPQDGDTVLVDLAEQVDPDTGSRFGLRAWWPETDDAGRLVGLSLKARPGSSVTPLVATAPEEARAVGRLVARIELRDPEL